MQVEKNCEKGEIVEITVIRCKFFNKVLDKWAGKHPLLKHCKE